MGAVREAKVGLMDADSKRYDQKKKKNIKKICQGTRYPMQAKYKNNM